jgi:LytS/YehU family sensor histidine kinase
MKHREKALMEELSQINGNEHHAKFERKNMIPPPHFDGKGKYLPGKPPMHHKMMFCFISVLSIGLLIIGFNSGIKVFIRWTMEKEERNEKEKHYLSTELAYLKQQVSPHFFMNTLNNIHALIDIDSERAKDAIVKLSHMMRYLLYETETDKVTLSKEIEFIDSYIELMRLRYDEGNLSINIKYTENTKPVYVPSLLFLPLIENAFKHGVATKIKSFVNINFDVENDRLIFKIENSNFPKASSEFNEASGIGLENIRKRLALIYGEDYIFQIHSDDEIFNVSLSIPIS